jgi:hypothetical protein
MYTILYWMEVPRLNLVEEPGVATKVLYSTVEGGKQGREKKGMVPDIQYKPECQHGLACPGTVHYSTGTLLDLSSSTLL